MTVSVGSYKLSRPMTKPTKWPVCPAKTQFSLGFCIEEALGQSLPIKRTAMTLIRLGECPGWSESSLDTHHFVGFVMQRLQYVSYLCKREWCHSCVAILTFDDTKTSYARSLYSISFYSPVKTIKVMLSLGQLTCSHCSWAGLDLLSG